VWVETDLFDKGEFYKYSMSLYHAVLMLTGNDIGPRGSFQISFVTSMLITGAIINANIFGNMAVILQSLNRKDNYFQEKLDNANETMKNLNINYSLQEEIKAFFTFTQNTQDHQSELRVFMNTLSPSLSQKVIFSIFQDIITTNPIFGNNKASINHVLESLEICLYLPENKVITQGHEGLSMYFIARGECDVTVITEKNKEVMVAEIKEGDYFGEVCLLKDCKRTATVISKSLVYYFK
jgi:hypothetical protein